MLAASKAGFPPLPLSCLIFSLPLRACAGGDASLRGSLQQDEACWQQTRFGPVYVRDGLLGLANPAFFTKEQLRAMPAETASVWHRDGRGLVNRTAAGAVV